MAGIVIVNGIRYRPEDAPAAPEPEGAEVKQAPVPQNKARDAASKGGRRGTPPAPHRG